MCFQVLCMCAAADYQYKALHFVSCVFRAALEPRLVYFVQLQYAFTRHGA